MILRSAPSEPITLPARESQALIYQTLQDDQGRRLWINDPSAVAAAAT